LWFCLFSVLWHETYVVKFSVCFRYSEIYDMLQGLTFVVDGLNKFSTEMMCMSWLKLLLIPETGVSRCKFNVAMPVFLSCELSHCMFCLESSSHHALVFPPGLVVLITA
jgi:hypothetical protein